jgi:hypothetical protein
MLLEQLRQQRQEAEEGSAFQKFSIANFMLDNPEEEEEYGGNQMSVVNQEAQSVVPQSQMGHSQMTRNAAAEDEMRIEGDMPSNVSVQRRYFEVEKDDGSRLMMRGREEPSENPRPIFNKFDFSFQDLMVAKKPGAKRSHREMMMSSTTSSVVKG